MSKTDDEDNANYQNVENTHKTFLRQIFGKILSYFFNFSTQGKQRKI